jgi:hypothetical protein
MIVSFTPSGVVIGESPHVVLKLNIDAWKKLTIRLFDYQWVIDETLLSKYQFALKSKNINNQNFIIDFFTYISFILLIDQPVFYNLLPFAIQLVCHIDSADACDTQIISYFSPIYKGIHSSVKANHWLYHFATVLDHFTQTWQFAFHTGPKLSPTLITLQQSIIETSLASMTETQFVVQKSPRMDDLQFGKANA